MGVDDAFRLSGRPRGKENQGLVIEEESGAPRLELGFCPLAGFVPAGENRDPEPGERCSQAGLWLPFPDREARFRRASQDFHFKRGQAAVYRNGATSQFPDGQEIDEKLQRVSVMQEDSVRTRETKLGILFDASADQGQNSGSVPVPSVQIGQWSYHAIQKHAVSHLLSSTWKRIAHGCGRIPLPKEKSRAACELQPQDFSLSGQCRCHAGELFWED